LRTGTQLDGKSKPLVEKLEVFQIPLNLLASINRKPTQKDTSEQIQQKRIQDHFKKSCTGGLIGAATRSKVNTLGSCEAICLPANGPIGDATATGENNGGGIGLLLKFLPDLFGESVHRRVSCLIAVLVYLGGLSAE